MKNSSKKNKILFISHEASNTGAPILLLNLARAITEISEYKIDFAFTRGGPLIKRFEAIGDIINLYERTGNKLLKKILPANDSSNEYEFILLNTLSHGDLLPLIKKKYQARIITYAHELETVAECLLNENSLNHLLNFTDIFFVPCDTVKQFLITAYQVEPSKIKVLPYYIPSIKEDNQESSLKHKDDFIIGGCGAAVLRKGTDLFIQLALIFKHTYPEVPVKFIWKGADINSLDYKLFNQDINRLNLETTCILEKSTDNIDAFYEQLDVFVLTSREDAYPLVVLEAAGKKIPSICFKDSGGATEFIEGNGQIVDYLNIEQMAAAIFKYYCEPEIRYADGNTANLKLKEWHQDKAKIVKEFFEMC